MTKILLITHQTSKTGAPYTILLIFKEILKKYKNIELDIFALSSTGELKNEFVNICKNFYYPEKYYGYKKTFYEKILAYTNHRDYSTPQTIALQEVIKNKYDIIYSNTILSIPIALEIRKKTKGRLIAHIHELSHAIQECLPNFEEFIPHINFYFVPSNENLKLLTKKYKINPSKIVVSREAAVPPLTTDPTNHEETYFNVYMCGSANWRKGFDLFLLLANSVILIDSNIHFFWLGHQDTANVTSTNIELDKLSTKNNIHFLGEVSNVYDTIKRMNCFVLTSREDPFPLAAIEAGMSGLPIICFNKGNGIKEVLKDQDLIVDYLNLNQMKDKIIELKNDTNRLKKIKSNNLETFNEFNPINVSELIVKKLNLDFKEK